MHIIVLILAGALCFAGLDTDKSDKKKQEKKKRTDYKAIVDNNIFAPPKPKRKPRTKPTSKKKEPKKPNPKPLPPAWEVTSVFLHEDEGAWKIIVEKSGADFEVLKAGDKIDDVEIVSIESRKIVVKFEDKDVEVKLGGDLPRKKPKVEEKAETLEGKKDDKKDGKAPEAKKDDKKEEPKKDNSNVLERLKGKYKKKPLPEPPDDD